MSICVSAWEALERLRVDGKNTGQEYRRHEKEVMIQKMENACFGERIPKWGTGSLAFPCDALSDCLMAGCGLV
jgi:hypothetical protein